MFCQNLHKTSNPKIEFAIDIPRSEERGTFLGHISHFFLRLVSLFFAMFLPTKRRTLHRKGGKRNFGMEFGMATVAPTNSFFRLRKKLFIDATVGFRTENGEFRPIVFTGIVIPARRCGGLCCVYS